MLSSRLVQMEIPRFVPVLKRLIVRSGITPENVIATSVKPPTSSCIVAVFAILPIMLCSIVPKGNILFPLTSPQLLQQNNLHDYNL